MGVPPVAWRAGAAGRAGEGGRAGPGGRGEEGRAGRAGKAGWVGVGGLGVYGGLGNQAGHTCKEVDSAGLAGTVVGRGQGCARSPRGCERDPTQTI